MQSLQSMCTAMLVGFVLLTGSGPAVAQDVARSPRGHNAHAQQLDHAPALALHSQKVAGTSEQTKTSPDLDPASHKQFFKKDYPDDLRTPPVHRFSFPFPAVQDSEDYDKDFVKDENSDGGEWKAQQEYDQLKSKLRKQEEDLLKYKLKKGQDEHDLSTAINDEADTEKRVKDAEDKTAAQEAKLEAARKDLDTATDYVPGFTHSIDDAVAHLKECEEELERARANLRSLTAQRDQALKRNKDADEARKVAEKEEVAAEQAAALSRKNTATAKAEVDAADKTMGKYRDEIGEMEKKMKAAEAKLRKFRGESIDQDGGVYRTDSSNEGAQPSALWLRGGSATKGIFLPLIFAALACLL